LNNTLREEGGRKGSDGVKGSVKRVDTQERGGPLPLKREGQREKRIVIRYEEVM